MLKLVATVTKVLRPGIHKIATVQEGEVRPVALLPLPNRVEIVMDGGRQDPCMMYRYTYAGDNCGDTWHANLDDAFHQAKFEYGLVEDDFLEAEE